ncbi:MAG: flavodoxin domain-containing protein [Candidatus Thorarchaeota archaeon]
MKVAIIYGTNRKKAMVKVVKWLEETVKEDGHEVSVGKPSEFDSIDYDLIIIGSSVYIDTVVEEITKFVEKYSETLRGKKVATFLVCKETTKQEENLEQILCLLVEMPINKMFIEGYMFREGDFDRQENKAKEWAKEVLISVSS